MYTIYHQNIKKSLLSSYVSQKNDDLIPNYYIPYTSPSIFRITTIMQTMHSIIM